MTKEDRRTFAPEDVARILFRCKGCQSEVWLRIQGTDVDKLPLECPCCKREWMRRKPTTLAVPSGVEGLALEGLRAIAHGIQELWQLRYELKFEVAFQLQSPE
jgi:hypothetical protein